MDWIFVIVRAIPLYTTFYIVSIHLMLLFIADRQHGKILLLSFQYISCYSLSFSGGKYGNQRNVSIHLMLLFIQKVAEGSGKKCKFQYISCYSLSGFVQYPIFNCNSFNTSHVTLYRGCRCSSVW